MAKYATAENHKFQQASITPCNKIKSFHIFTPEDLWIISYFSNSRRPHMQHTSSESLHQMCSQILETLWSDWPSGSNHNTFLKVLLYNQMSDYCLSDYFIISLHCQRFSDLFMFPFGRHCHVNAIRSHHPWVFVFCCLHASQIWASPVVCTREPVGFNQGQNLDCVYS